MKDNSSQDRLNQMKEDYQQIPIPDSLLSKVTESIQTAREGLDTTEPSSRKRRIFSSIPGGKRPFHRKRFIKAASVAAAAVLLITVMANSGEEIAYAMSDIPVLGAMARIVTFRQYSHSGNKMEANVKVPAVSVEDPDGMPLEDATTQLNQEIYDYTSQIIDAYVHDLEATQGESYESVELDYTIVTDNQRLFTLRFDQSILMASSMHSTMIYNLDKRTGELLDLEDLFLADSDYITVISDYLKEEMLRQMEEDSYLYYFYQSDTPATDFEAIAPDENFYISEDGLLTLVFDKYEIAPGYMGVVEFEIPTEIIQSMIREGFVS